MVIRKILTILIGTLLSYSVLAVGFMNESLDVILFMLMITYPFIFLYGLPVTILSDKITKDSLGVKRVIKAFLFHVLFGMGFVFVLSFFFDPHELFFNFKEYWSSEGELLFFAATLTSFFFWLVDEGIRCFQRKYCYSYE
ncbi:hypothetical protein SAMN05877753_103334 [Bacillus oleivorans]|uniref:Uncharacterized protein n=1 Tax=Bacillus oleivorans TaxID=1448271 RepID=A0A285CQZ3_9BACI|nr:hypothetical protein [Bacillus oleivorans]SNX69952.1 hypothetical protein SAMN05877753_103334 [Bacillus oleivorans]